MLQGEFSPPRLGTRKSGTTMGHSGLSRACAHHTHARPPCCANLSSLVCYSYVGRALELLATETVDSAS